MLFYGYGSYLSSLSYIFVLQKRRTQNVQNVFGAKTYPFLASSLAMNKRKWKLFLQCLVMALFTFALARPQMGESEQKVKSEGVELVFLFDVSRSMLAEDIKPSRLELAKRELIRFIDFGGGDRIGLIAFAGSGVILSPMTTDKSALKMYIESLQPNSVSTQGTEFRRALLSAQSAFERGGKEEERGSVVTRAVVVISDGEDNEDGAIEAAKKLNEDGIKIFSLAIGTEKGAAIPVRDRRGELRGYRKDKSGKVVISKTKGTILKQLANIGGGSFHHITFGGNAMQLLRKDLENLSKAEFESATIKNYDERYQLVLLLAILLGFVEFFLGEKRGVGRLWRGRFEVQQQ